MILSAENLTLRRGTMTLATGLSLRLEPGQMMALTGPNGCGKTTLLLTLAGLLRPADGCVRIDGHAVDRADRARHIRWISPDNPVKPSLTVLENLAFWAGMEKADTRRDALVAALHRLQCAHLSDRVTGTLSTGQRRRVALTRLFIAPRPIWLLDEPALSLDRDAADDLIACAQTHCGDGGAVIVATHRPDAWRAAHNIAFAPGDDWREAA